VVFQAGAGFAQKEDCEAREDWGTQHAIRSPANHSLARNLMELLRRSVGPPSHRAVVWGKSLLG
jgi:hypothetical protein